MRSIFFGLSEMKCTEVHSFAQIWPCFPSETHRKREDLEIPPVLPAMADRAFDLVSLTTSDSRYIGVYAV